jgi:hypothetical protein
MQLEYYGSIHILMLQRLVDIGLTGHNMENCLYTITKLEYVGSLAPSQLALAFIKIVIAAGCDLNRIYCDEKDTNSPFFFRFIGPKVGAYKRLQLLLQKGADFSL